MFLQMPNVQQKNIKQQRNMAHSNEKKSPESAIEEAQALELLDNDFKPTVLNMLKKLKGNMDKD